MYPQWNFDADLEKSGLGSKTNFKKKEKKKEKKIFCKTILLAVRRQSVKRHTIFREMFKGYLGVDHHEV